MGSLVGGCDTVVGPRVAASVVEEVGVASGAAGVGVGSNTGDLVSTGTSVAGSVGGGVSVAVAGAGVASGVGGDVATGVGVAASVGERVASGAAGTGVGSGRGGDVVTGAGLGRLTGDDVVSSRAIGAGVGPDVRGGVVGTELEPEGWGGNWDKQT